MISVVWVIAVVSLEAASAAEGVAVEAATKKALAVEGGGTWGRLISSSSCDDDGAIVTLSWWCWRIGSVDVGGVMIAAIVGWSGLYMQRMMRHQRR